MSEDWEASRGIVNNSFSVETTVTPKSVAMSNIDVVLAVHHRHPWESCLALVRPNIVLTLSYKLVPGSCDVAQGRLRYTHFKTAMSLQHVFHF